jgi:adenosylcobinamide hydrolase
LTHPSPVLASVRGASLPVLVWPVEPPMMAIASAPLGGGIGPRAWVVNVEVPSDYARTDIELHLRELAASAGLRGNGIGFLTATAVSAWTSGADGDITAYATVGLDHPTWAASDEAPEPVSEIGTINIVAFLPARLTDTALVNAAMTVTEAKAQALFEHGIAGTGTASDALSVLAPIGGQAEIFGGPRSRIGASLARAVHQAVAAGVTASSERSRPNG